MALMPFFGFRGFGDLFDPLPHPMVGPQANVREAPNFVEIELEVPRFRPDDIAVNIDANSGLITVEGHRASVTEEEQEHLLFSSSPLSNFRKHYRFSPQHYDFGNVSWKVDCGIFQLRLPKRQVPPPPQPVVVYGQPQAGQSQELVETTTPEQMALFRQAAWPPSLKVDEAANALTYKCQLPAGVTQDHVELDLYGRSLVLSVNYSRHRRTAHGEDSESATYSTSFPVPEGTTPTDIHTAMGENNTLAITVDKHGAAAPAATAPAAAAPATAAPPQPVVAKEGKKKHHGKK